MLALLALGLYSWPRRGPAALPAPAAQPAPAELSPAPAEVPTPPPPSAAVADVVESMPAPLPQVEPARKARSSKRPARTGQRPIERPITRGLSIDPFAEAANRRSR